MFRLLLINLILMIAVATTTADETEVDVELVLAVDVSRSMTATELEIQRRGYAEALVDPDVIAAIQAGQIGKIALTYVEWAATGSNRIIVDWTVVENAEDAARIAQQLTADYSRSMRRTSISGAIDLSVELIESNNFFANRRVIDISGDGPNNNGRPVNHARDRAIDKRITINGLPLMTSEGVNWFFLPDLDVYYQNCVIGGPGAFVIPVLEWDQFPEAVRRKLILELAAMEKPELPNGSEWLIQASLHVPQKPDYDCLIGEKTWEQRRQELWDDN